MNKNRNRFLGFLGFLVLLSNTACVNSQKGDGADAGAQEGGASSFTQQVQEAQYQKLDFADTSDFADIKRGFIATYKVGISGKRTIDTLPPVFTDVKSADNINPALWRITQYYKVTGLFKVTEGIYQVRGFNIANITFIDTPTGYIVVDPLSSPSAAKASFDLLKERVADKPVIAIISTHSHADHYAGISGVAQKEDVTSGKIPYIAPADFFKEAASEGGLLGNAMQRRGLYQFGVGIPTATNGISGKGIGIEALGERGPLWYPTITIEKTGQSLKIGGLTLVFQLTPETEAPAHLTFFIPEKRTFFSADLIIRSVHNLLPPRGTKVRSGKGWAYYINEAIGLFADRTDYIVQGHGWPVFGREQSLNYLEKQRDLYRYIHDQTIHLINKGLNADEIAEELKLPESLRKEWFIQEFYGTVRTDVRAVYQHYIGWYDGNPANYDRLPQEEEAKRYVKWFGGEAAALKKAKESYDEGDYRWVAQSLKWVVFANPANQDAKNLQADAFEQLAYQTTSGIWRNLYLLGAKELREGNITKGLHLNIGRFINDLSGDDLFNYLSVAIDGNKADGKDFSIRFHLLDENKQIYVSLKNGVLHHVSDQQSKADLSLSISSDKLKELIVAPQTIPAALASSDVKYEGDAAKLTELISLVDSFDFDWNIVTP